MSVEDGQQPVRLVAPAACLLPPGDPTTVICAAGSSWGELRFQMVHAARRRGKGGHWVHTGPPQPSSQEVFGVDLSRRVPEMLADEAVATVALAGRIYFKDDLLHAEADTFLRRFLIAFARSVGRVPVSDDPLELAERFAAERLDSGVTVADMARAAGLSVGRLTDLWRARRGETPGACLDRLRLAEACRLLAQGRSVLACSQMCGYRSPTAFTAWFKRRVGMTPSSWCRSQAAVRVR